MKEKVLVVFFISIWEDDGWELLSLCTQTIALCTQAIAGLKLKVQVLSFG